MPASQDIDFAPAKITIPVWSARDGWSQATIEATIVPEATLNMVIGANLRSLRHRESLRLDQLADLLNRTGFPVKWSAAKLSQFENGKKTITVDQLYLFSWLYRVRILALLRPPDDFPDFVTIGGYCSVRTDELELDFVLDPAGAVGVTIDPRLREGDPLDHIDLDEPKGLAELLERLIEQDFDIREKGP